MCIYIYTCIYMYTDQMQVIMQWNAYTVQRVKGTDLCSCGNTCVWNTWNTSVHYTCNLHLIGIGTCIYLYTCIWYTYIYTYMYLNIITIIHIGWPTYIYSIIIMLNTCVTPPPPVYFIILKGGTLTVLDSIGQGDKWVTIWQWHEVVDLPYNYTYYTLSWQCPLAWRPG